MIGVVPVQAPGAAVSVWPSCASPDTVGSVATAGGTAWTIAVWEEGALALPTAFDAWTTTVIVPPESALMTVYVVLVAPAIGLQFAPFESQRCHW